MARRVMDVFSELRNQVNLAKKKGSNMLVYTFSGSGCTHYLKELARTDKDLSYINYEGMVLGQYNLLDLPLDQAINYIKTVSVKQKYLLVVGSGLEFHSPTVREVVDHLYLTFPLRAGSVNDIRDMIRRFGSKQDYKTLNLIMKLSGGIPKLAKYIIVHEGKVDEQDITFQSLVGGISDSISGYSPSELKSLAIIDKSDNFSSELLAKHISKVLPIKVNFDLSFEEKGILSSAKLTALEAKIINKMLQNGGSISKAEVSDIKWGTGKYDQFSDQAINKQMRRLSQKFSKFSIKTIPKVGFEIQ